MTFEEKKQQASDLIGDMRIAIKRKNRLYNRYLKHGALDAAIDAAADIEIMETELQCEQELFDLTFNCGGG